MYVLCRMTDRLTNHMNSRFPISNGHFELWSSFAHKKNQLKDIIIKQQFIKKSIDPFSIHVNVHQTWSQ